MGKYLINFVVTSVLFVTAIFGFNVLVDPKYENGLLLVHGFNSIKTQNSHQTCQTYRNRLRNEQVDVVFGTSRTLLYSPSLTGRPTFNFHCLYGNPHAIAKFLSELDPEHIKNIGNVYFLLDIALLNGKDMYVEVSPDQNLFDQIITSAHLGNLRPSLKTVFYNVITESGNRHSRRFPMPHYYNAQFGNQVLHDHPAEYDSKYWDMPFPKTLTYTSDTIAQLSKIKNFFVAHKKNHVFFTATLPDVSLYKLDFETLESRWNLLVEHTGGFYNLYYVPGISDGGADGKFPYFFDPSHLNHEGVKAVFTEIIQVRNPQYLVNENTIHRQIESLKQYAHEARDSYNRRTASK